MKFVVRRSSDGQFWWQLVAGNGEVMASSERMTRKQSCLDSIASVQKNAGDAEVDDRTDQES